VIKLFDPLKKVEEDVCLIATATASKDVMKIDVIDIKEHYEHLASSATSRFHALLKTMATNSEVFKNSFRDIV
jgi:hypothetical protein